MPVKKKQCIIDGQTVHTIGDFYREVAWQLHFPPYFSNNLDALWDVLTTDIKGPVRMIWSGAKESRRDMGDDFERVITLLQQVGQERKDFHFTIQE